MHRARRAPTRSRPCRPSARCPLSALGRLGPMGPMSPCGPRSPFGSDAPAGPVTPRLPVSPRGPAGPTGPCVPAGPCAPAGPANADRAGGPGRTALALRPGLAGSRRRTCGAQAALRGREGRPHRWRPARREARPGRLLQSLPARPPPLVHRAAPGRRVPRPQLVLAASAASLRREPKPAPTLGAERDRGGAVGPAVRVGAPRVAMRPLRPLRAWRPRSRAGGSGAVA